MRQLLSSGLWTTTIIDYYGLPDDVPGMDTRPAGDPYARLSHVEDAMAADVGHGRFLPHLVLHELETWVFAAADQLGEMLGSPEVAHLCNRAIVEAGSPELINDSPQTAPSKRLLEYYPAYLKTTDGPAALSELGLDRLRSRCPH